MLRRLYDWTMDLAAHRHALWALGAISFVESSFFPIPPDVLIIPMVLAARDQAWKIALIATITSVLGGLAGYGIGVFLFDSVGQMILEFYGKVDAYADFQVLYAEWGAWIVAAAGFTPIPYKVFTIASGALSLDPAVFTFASALSRGARFFILAGLLWYFGPPIKSFIEKHLPILATLFFVMLFAGFLAIRYLF
ncbi:YqaA family protein [Denitrobaculum tricleocarpae]|uniref:DedA family protein n=1 Tax=Denitrobaculum tricleocarpae TaxID=2591009 RepID=A0A545U1W0_9PROT|nr:YqaA family protein [Denitrobaculum tricleocarpae]TQV83424.1 DedA family protein [Denitrobaculum tricleocarpae]